MSIMPLVADGTVARGTEVEPRLTIPSPVLIAKVLKGAPLTVNEAASVVDPATKATLPLVEPTPAGVTTTTPPWPTVNWPKLMDVPLTCLTTTGAMTTAEALPVPEDPFPPAHARLENGSRAKGSASAVLIIPGTTV